MSRRKIILIGLVVAAVVLLASAYVFFGKKQINLLPGGELPQSGPLSRFNLDLGSGKQEGKSETVTLNGITLNNFHKQGIEANKYGDWLVVDKPEYQILYFESTSSFLISITKAPFADIRRRAEEEFLGILGVSKEEVCKLNVIITTPEFANPKESGASYKLSFCE